LGNDEFEMFWEALVVAYVRCYPIICSKKEETEENHETHQLQYPDTVTVRDEIQTRLIFFTT